MEKAKEPIKIWAKPLRNGNKALYLRRYIAGSHSKGMFMRNWMVCFSLMTRRAKTKMQKRETTMHCKLQHLSSASESKST